jgi:hypothetical protein
MKTALVLFAGLILATLMVLLGEVIAVRMKCDALIYTLDEVNVRTLKQGTIGEVVK